MYKVVYEDEVYTCYDGEIYPYAVLNELTGKHEAFLNTYIEALAWAYQSEQFYKLRKWEEMIDEAMDDPSSDGTWHLDMIQRTDKAN